MRLYHIGRQEFSLGLLVVGPVECHGHSLPQFSIRGDVVSRASQQVRDILLDKGLTQKISHVFPRFEKNRAAQRRFPSETYQRKCNRSSKCKSVFAAFLTLMDYSVTLKSKGRSKQHSLSQHFANRKRPSRIAMWPQADVHLEGVTAA